MQAALTRSQPALRHSANKEAEKTVCTSGQESLHRFLQYRVIRVRFQRIVPYFFRLFLFALHPQHLAQMCGDFRVRISGIGTTQEFQTLGDVTEAIVPPAYAVYDGEITRGKLVGLLGLRVIRLDLDYFA